MAVENRLHSKNPVLPDLLVEAGQIFVRLVKNGSLVNHMINNNAASANFNNRKNNDAITAYPVAAPRGKACATAIAPTVSEFKKSGNPKIKCLPAEKSGIAER